MPTDNIFADMLDRVRRANDALIAESQLPAGIDQSRVTVEPPRDPTHGDMATNAAMVLAKDAGKKPRDLAQAIAEKLRSDPLIGSVEVAGPGFINITLKPAAWIETLRIAVRLGPRYGRSEVGGGTPVNVEYVSANPTGPMHIGHFRGAVFGDALANLLVFTGFEVTREYYVNDAGAQVDQLARSAYLRYREALGETIGPIPEGLYPGDYLKGAGVELATEFGAGLRDVPEGEWLPVVRARAIAAMMAMIRDDLAALGVTHGVFFSEASLNGERDRVAEAIAALRGNGIIYEGPLRPPHGAPMDDWEDREQPLLRSTSFGDDVDRPLAKADGGYTYFASDIAYHKDKIARNFRALVDVWGADHAGYVKRMQAAVAALSGGKAKLEVRLCQLVRLMRAGEPVKMSKRSGEFVTLREVVEEVGADAVRFMMLMRKNDAPLDFDLAKVIEQSQDNPVFYVQYAHARARSVMRQGKLVFADFDLDHKALAEADFALLTDEGERELMRTFGQYPRVVRQAAEAHEPHRIAFFAHDLATRFHAHWNRGKDAPRLRFVNEKERNLSYARLALVAAVSLVLASALSILGVSAPEEMR